MNLTLYYHPLSSFCHKALIALYENGTEFERRIIDLGNAQDRTELRAHWPLCKFPVIHDRLRNRDVPESSIIIEYLQQFYPGEQPLLPQDQNEQLEVRLWDRFFDNHVQGPMQQIVNDRLSQTNGDMTMARTALRTAYEMIDNNMASRTWMASRNFSMADCAAAPALFYATTLEPIPGESVHLQAYFDRLMDRASCRRVLDEAKPYFHLYPFAAAIPTRFRA